MKIIVTGCNGQLGSSFVKISKNFKHKFYFFDKKNLNIINKSIVEKLVKKIEPDYFINCSAYTNVNNAEIELNKSWNINSTSLKIISNICKKYKTTLIHFSTDYVFDGKKKSPYLEIDKTAPLSSYGKSKLGGENEILISGVNYMIVRISWLYNPFFKDNIIYKLIQNIINKKQFSAVNNEISKPTCSLNLANNILSIISFNKKLKNINSIFHYSDIGNPVSIYELSNFIKKNIKFKLYSAKINPINPSNLSSKIVRPAYSVLSNRNFLEKFDISTYNWRKLLNNNIRDFF